MILYTCRSTACSALGVGAGLVLNRMRGDSRQGWRAEATTQRGWRHGQRCARVLNRRHAHMECANAVACDGQRCA